VKFIAFSPKNQPEHSVTLPNLWQGAWGRV